MVQWKLLRSTLAPRGPWLSLTSTVGEPSAADLSLVVACHCTRLTGEPTGVLVQTEEPESPGSALSVDTLQAYIFLRRR